MRTGKKRRLVSSEFPLCKKPTTGLQLSDLLKPVAKRAESDANSVGQPLQDEEAGRFFGHRAIREHFDEFRPINFFADHQELSKVVDREVSRVVKMAATEDNVGVRVDVGRLCGILNGKDVILPILSDTVLSGDDAALATKQIEFNPYRPVASHSEILMGLSSMIQNRNQLANFVDMEIQEKSGVFDTYSDGISGWQGSEHSCETALSSLYVYRPNTRQHLHVTAFSRVPIEVDQLDRATLVRSSAREVQEVTLYERDSKIEWTVTLDFDATATVAGDDDGDQTGALKLSVGFSDKFWRKLQTAHKKFGDTEDFSGLINVLAGLLLQNSRILSQCDNFAESLNGGGSIESKSLGLYYPNYFGDTVSDVRRHYNLKKITTAARSAIEVVRRVNNYAKRLLIREFVPKFAKVLDLACGHGQDLLKYGEKDLKVFIGVDISSEEIKEARLRYRGKNKRNQYRNQQSNNKPPEVCRFHVGNMLVPEEYAKFLKDEFATVDVVSVQLAIHYTLGSEEDARLILRSIACRLNEGGIFLGSLPSSFVIAERTRTKLKRDVLEDNIVQYVISNEVYSITYDSDTLESLRGTPDIEIDGLPIDQINNTPINLDNLPSNPWIAAKLSDSQANLSRVHMGFGDFDAERHAAIESNPLMFQLNERWGLRYSFWLVDHIDAAEWIVPWRAFCRIALDYGLRCLLCCSFDEYCQKRLAAVDKPEEAQYFLDNIREVMKNNTTAEEQEEVISFYQVFAFRKETAAAAAAGCATT